MKTSYNNWCLAKDDSASSHLLFPLTGHGVLFPPGSVGSAYDNETTFRSLTPKNDDIWLKAALLANDVPCRLVSKRATGMFTIRGSQNEALYDNNSRMNDEYLTSALNHLNVWARLQQASER